MFNIQLKILREAAGFRSQNSLAQKMNIGQSTIAGWESGTREPSIKHLSLLADILGVSVDELIGRDLFLSHPYFLDLKRYCNYTNKDFSKVKSFYQQHPECVYRRIEYLPFSFLESNTLRSILGIELEKALFLGANRVRNDEECFDQLERYEHLSATNNSKTLSADALEVARAYDALQTDDAKAMVRRSLQLEVGNEPNAQRAE